MTRCKCREPLKVIYANRFQRVEQCPKCGDQITTRTAKPRAPRPASRRDTPRVTQAEAKRERKNLRRLAHS